MRERRGKACVRRAASENDKHLPDLTPPFFIRAGSSRISTACSSLSRALSHTPWSAPPASWPPSRRRCVWTWRWALKRRPQRAREAAPEPRLPFSSMQAQPLGVSGAAAATVGKLVNTFCTLEGLEGAGGPLKRRRSAHAIGYWPTRPGVGAGARVTALRASRPRSRRPFSHRPGWWWWGYWSVDLRGGPRATDTSKLGLREGERKRPAPPMLFAAVC